METDPAPKKAEATTTTSSQSAKRHEFHLAAWLAPTLITVGTFIFAVIANWQGWEMYAMILAIVGMWLLAVILLWFLPGKQILKWT